MNHMIPSQWKKQYEVKNNEVEDNLKKHCITYSRVSSDGQEKDWHGYEWQETHCESWAKNNNVEIHRTFRDDPITWANLSKPWLNEAVKYLQKHNRSKKNIHYFVTTELSRIVRPDHLDEWILLLARIRKADVEIVDANSGTIINRDNDMQVLLAVFKLSQAKAERLGCIEGLSVDFGHSHLHLLDINRFKSKLVKRGM